MNAVKERDDLLDYYGTQTCKRSSLSHQKLIWMQIKKLNDEIETGIFRINPPVKSRAWWDAKYQYYFGSRDQAIHPKFTILG